MEPTKLKILIDPLVDLEETLTEVWGDHPAHGSRLYMQLLKLRGVIKILKAMDQGVVV